MAVSKFIGENVDKPFPWSWLLVFPLLELELGSDFLSNSAIWI
jgi:hypothetical protein